MPTARDYIVIFINGQRHNIGGSRAFMMLADFLRYELRLVGTKIVCAEGDCGACTVLYYRSQTDFSPKLVPINACIAQVALLDGCHIVTVEALKEGPNLSAVQCSMVKHHASQCGFCTPGFAMAISAMFEQPVKLEPQKIKNCLTGNLCRCTGYQPIIDSVLATAAPKKTLSERYITESLDNELKNAIALPVHINDEQEFYAPLSIADASRWRLLKKDSCIISGSTDVGVWVNKGKFIKKPLLSLHLIEELYQVQKTQNRVMVGARASFSTLRRFLKDECPEITHFLNIFASPQIKNIATLVGNIANASPIGDSLPLMMVADGQVHVVGDAQARTVAMEDLYTGYKTLALLPHEIITHASFLLPKKTSHFKLLKVSQRKDLDISTINAAFLCELEQDRVSNIKLALGGVFSSVLRLKKTERYLSGQKITAEVVEHAIAIMQNEISPLSDLRGSTEHRRRLCEQLLQSFLAEVKVPC